jgi:uncharacterized protein (DUF849 family)
MAERIYAAGVKPELEVFDAGDIVLARDLIAHGTLQQPALFQIVTGTSNFKRALRQLYSPIKIWSSGGETSDV